MRGSARIALWVLGVPAALGATYLGHSLWQAHGRRSQAEAALADFRGCLYGEPLAVGEKPSQRLQAIELCPSQPADWPARCVGALLTVQSALDELGVTVDDPELGRAKRVIRVATGWKDETFPWLNGVDGPSIDTLEESLARGGMPAGAFAAGATRCTARAELTQSDAVALGPVDGYRGSTERVHDKALRLLVSGSELALACWLAPEGDAVARCAAPGVHIGASLLSSDVGLQDLVARDFRGTEVDQPYALVAGLSGEKLLLSSDRLVEDGWARADGTQVALTSSGVITVRNGEAPVLPRPASVPGQRSWLLLQPGWLLWGVAAEDPDSHVFGAPWDDRTGTFGDAVGIGMAPGRPTARGCRDEQGALVLALVSGTSDFTYDSGVALQAVDVRVAFPNGKGGFAPLVSAEVRMPWNTTMDKAPDWAAELGCRADGSPRWVWLQNDVVHELSCRPSGCKQSTSKPLNFGELRVVKVGLAPVGDDDVLLAYDGERRGKLQTLLHAIRYRRAPIATIASEPERVLIADQHYGGLESLWEGVYVFGRGDVGWVAVRAKGMLYAFRTGPQGALVPVKTSEATKLP